MFKTYWHNWVEWVVKVQWIGLVENIIVLKENEKKISGVGVCGWICETWNPKVHGWSYGIKREVDKEVELNSYGLGNKGGSWVLLLWSTLSHFYTFPNAKTTLSQFNTNKTKNCHIIIS